MEDAGGQLTGASFGRHLDVISMPTRIYFITEAKKWMRNRTDLSSPTPPVFHSDPFTFRSANPPGEERGWGGREGMIPSLIRSNHPKRFKER